jgi:ubiquinone/menaquinone biosynthesis C-methylase UbiE
MVKRLWWRLVRFGFHLLYNQMAWTYDVVSWLVSLGQWRRWQEAALPYVCGPRVLEIAHGPGHMLLGLAREGYAVTGLDLSPAMGCLASRRLQRHGVPHALVRGQAQELPFATASFDTILATFPTLFIAEAETWTAAYRVLRPGGRFIIVPEGHLTGEGVLHRFIAWLFVITGQRPGETEEGQWPEESELAQALMAQIEAAGFGLQIHHLTLARSAVTVVVATREA